MKSKSQFKSFLFVALFASGAAIAQPAGPGSPGNMDPATSGGVATAVKQDWKPSLRKDGVIDRVEHNNYVTPWQPIREADVLWKKRIWREIDTRQKQNFAFRYPGDDESGGGMYIEILMDAIKNGKVTAFQDDRFTVPLSPEDVMAKLTGVPDTNEVEDPITGEIKLVITNRSFNPDDITRFRLKEDWIFDKNISRMVVRIIGISPYFDKRNADGSFRASVPLFWLYYPDVRGQNARYEVYNPENDVYRMTWDDFFEKRVFSSYILKSTINNPFQEDIKETKAGIDRLYESEQIREQIFNKEHDLWVY
jgi:gliding motility associated protien GldN